MKNTICSFKLVRVLVIAIAILLALSGLTPVSAATTYNVIGWGSSYQGETSVPSSLTDVVTIDAGVYHSIALKSDGTVASWGGGYFTPSDIPDGLSNVVTIAAGYYHNLALKGDGNLVIWGGYLDKPGYITPDESGIVAIAAGGWYNLALVLPDVPANIGPTANPGRPYLGTVKTSISFDGSLSSDLDGDPLTYAWTFGDGATGTGVTPVRAYTAAGVYNVCLTVNGGGRIDSPAGAYKTEESLSGKANFGFVAKYQKGVSVPTGTTAFEFDLAEMAFSSQIYEWLVVNQGGSNAQFKGSGLINGAADPNGNAYKFMLWAGDGSSTNSADTFRIRIWWEDAAGEHDVYDNGGNQVIDAGNIVVHTGK